MVDINPPSPFSLQEIHDESARQYRSIGYDLVVDELDDDRFLLVADNNGQPLTLDAAELGLRANGAAVHIQVGAFGDDPSIATLEAITRGVEMVFPQIATGSTNSAPSTSGDAVDEDASESVPVGVGSMSVRVQFEGNIVDERALAWLDRSLSEFDQAGPAAADGDSIVSVVRGISRTEYERFELREPEAVGIAIRPVIECGDAPDPDASLGQERLPHLDGQSKCVVGAPFGTGELFEPESATTETSEATGAISIIARLRNGPSEAAWNDAATQCWSRMPTCPSGQLAVVLDGVIQSAPTILEPTFGSAIQISGGFTENQANDLASAINLGASPEALRVDQVTLSFKIDED